MTLWNATTPDQNRPESDGNEGVLHIPFSGHLTPNEINLIKVSNNSA